MNLNLFIRCLLIKAVQIPAPHQAHHPAEICLCLLTSQWFTHLQVDTKRQGRFFPLHPHGSSASHHHQCGTTTTTWSPLTALAQRIESPGMRLTKGHAKCSLCINLTSRDPLPLIKPFALLPSPTRFSLHQYFSPFPPAAPEQFRTSSGCLPFCHMNLENLYIPIKRYCKHLKELERGQTVLLEPRPRPLAVILPP